MHPWSPVAHGSQEEQNASSPLSSKCLQPLHSHIRDSSGAGRVPSSRPTCRSTGKLAASRDVSGAQRGATMTSRLPDRSGWLDRALVSWGSLVATASTLAGALREARMLSIAFPSLRMSLLKVEADGAASPCLHFVDVQRLEAAAAAPRKSSSSSSSRCVVPCSLSLVSEPRPRVCGRMRSLKARWMTTAAAKWRPSCRDKLATMSCVRRRCTCAARAAETRALAVWASARCRK